MRTTHATLIAFLLGAVTVGCNGSQTSTPDGEDVGSTPARLVMAVQGSGGAKLRVTASDDATLAVVLDETVEVAAGDAAVLDLDLAPSMYRFHVDVMDSAYGDAHLAEASTHALVRADVTTELRLLADIAGTAENASAEVAIGADAAPQIHGVTVVRASDGTVEVRVDASDPDGDALRYFWSGAGIDGAVEGGPTLLLPTSTSGQVNVVVQGGLGAAEATNIVVTDDGTLDTMDREATLPRRCLQASAACYAACAVSFADIDTDAKGACFAGCGVELAACDAP